MDYFIDESGQSGDVAKLNALSGFSDQPIFCLAAVGVPDELSLEKEINRLREKHRIRVDELKSSARRERPEFTYDVVRLVCARQYPFFLEVMDKKYFLAAQITSRQLLPPIRGLAADPRTHFFQNLAADYLFERVGSGSSGSIRVHCASLNNSNRRLLTLPVSQTHPRRKSACLEAEPIYETASHNLKTMFAHSRIMCI